MSISMFIQVYSFTSLLELLFSLNVLRHSLQVVVRSPCGESVQRCREKGLWSSPVHVLVPSGAASAEASDDTRLDYRFTDQEMTERRG